MKIYTGDAREILQSFQKESIDCVVTSPPYYALRDYGNAYQIGLEPTHFDYLFHLSEVFDEVHRVLKPTGTCWVSIGDTYATGGRAGSQGKNSWKNGETPKYPKVPGKRTKSLLQIPERFALSMTERGWILRNEIIWHKPNCMPASVTDRFTVDHEKLYFFTKEKQYYFDQQFEPSKDPEDDVRRMAKAGGYARERQGGNSTFNSPHVDEARARERMLKGRNKRTVWSINTKPFRGAHFAVFPEELVRTPIRAGCPKKGTVLDPFMGSGTTLAVAAQEGREGIGIELNEKYVRIAIKRVGDAQRALETTHRTAKR